MLCRKCTNLFNGRNRRREDSTTFSTLYSHHPQVLDVVELARTKTCFICRVLNEKLDDLRNADLLGAQYYKRGASLVASINRVTTHVTIQELFHLEFKIEVKDRSKPRKHLASFILQQEADTSALDRLSIRPISPSTADVKVLDLAKEWLRECAEDPVNHPTCTSRRTAEPPFYPTRLIDILPFGRDSGATNIVRLVSSHPEEVLAGQQKFEGRYATLSHCWGKTPFERLVKNNRAEYQETMQVNKLPLTFQHAVTLARHLDIRWLWIDALCIVQDDTDDWLRESASMRQVYARAFVNISATASKDSSQGLFRKRDQSHDWFSTATLNIDGLAESMRCLVLDLSFWNKYIQQAPVNRRSWVLQERLLSRRVLHMCQDQIAFECRSLDRAECRPRGMPHYYMLRGRLVNGLNMKKIDAATGRQLRELRLPRGPSSSSGSRTAGGRLQEMVNSALEEDNPASKARWDYYEHWKRIVEEYTKMELTRDEDRLIALSGIARRIRDQINVTDEDYIAGLWKGGLAGQLLWYVNPIAGDKQPLVDLRPKDIAGKPIYRAPSFSWASVETHRGVTYGELTYDIPYLPLRAQVTDEDLRKDAIYMKVKIVRLAFKRKEDNFGIITDGYIVLKGVLRRVHLIDRKRRNEAIANSHITNANGNGNSNSNSHGTGDSGNALVLTQVARADTDIDTPSSTGNAFAWRLVREGTPIPGQRENSLVWLDSPATEPSPFGPNANVFAIPALRKSGSLICLLVQLETTGDYGPRYRRVGLTKILDLHMEAIKDILTPPGNRIKSDAKYYSGGEDQPTGENTMCII